MQFRKLLKALQQEQEVKNSPHGGEERFGCEHWVKTTCLHQKTRVSLSATTLLSSVFWSNQVLDTRWPFDISGIFPSRRRYLYICNSDASEHLHLASAQLRMSLECSLSFTALTNGFVPSTVSEYFHFTLKNAAWVFLRTFLEMKNRDFYGGKL